MALSLFSKHPSESNASVPSTQPSRTKSTRLNISQYPEGNRQPPKLKMKQTTLSTFLINNAIGPLLHLDDTPSSTSSTTNSRSSTRPTNSPGSQNRASVTSSKFLSCSLTTSKISTTPPSPTSVSPPPAISSSVEQHTVKASPIWPTPNPNIHITLPEPSHIQALKRLHALLLPIKYPDKFFSETVTPGQINSLSRVAIYQPPSSNAQAEATVVGAIRARLEDDIDATSTEQAPSTTHRRLKKKIYIQTLLLLSPHRNNGVAAALLASVLSSLELTPTIPSELKTLSSSPIQEKPPFLDGEAQNIQITAVEAHVWESNVDALGWYRRRGFVVKEGLVEGYYRRLKPSGAMVCRLEVGALRN